MELETGSRSRSPELTGLTRFQVVKSMMFAFVAVAFGLYVMSMILGTHPAFTLLSRLGR